MALKLFQPTTKAMFSKGVNTELLANTDMLVTTTGNYNVCDSDILAALKSGCVVCNIGHFDNEIDTAYMRDTWEWEESNLRYTRFIATVPQ